MIDGCHLMAKPMPREASSVIEPDNWLSMDSFFSGEITDM